MIEILSHFFAHLYDMIIIMFVNVYAAKNIGPQVSNNVNYDVSVFFISPMKTMWEVFFSFTTSMFHYLMETFSVQTTQAIVVVTFI